MGTRNDKTTAGVRVGRGSQGCFKTISRIHFAHTDLSGVRCSKGFLSRHASGQRDLNRPEGLRSRGTALKEIASEDRTNRASHRGLSNHLGASAPQPLCSSAPQLLRPSVLRPSAPLLLSPSASFPWLFSARTDLSVFLGSAGISLLALWVGARAACSTARRRIGLGCLRSC